MAVCECGSALLNNSLQCPSCGKRLSLDPRLLQGLNRVDSSPSDIDEKLRAFIEDYRPSPDKKPSKESMEEVLREHRLRQEKFAQSKTANSARSLTNSAVDQKYRNATKLKRDTRYVSLLKRLILPGLLIGFFAMSAAGVSINNPILTKLSQVVGEIPDAISENLPKPIPTAKILTNFKGHIRNPTLSDPGKVLPLPIAQTETRWTTRHTTDQPDLLEGFQLHPVYVIPSNGTDRGLDKSGQISNYLTQTNQLVKSQFGDSWQFDKTKSGAYDVTFLQSRFTRKQLLTLEGGKEASQSGDELLLKEYLANQKASENRKLYVFITDTDAGSDFCGYADASKGEIELWAVILAGEGCDSDQDGIAYVAKSIAHEVIHALGVEDHVDDPNDLMCGEPYNCDDSQTLYADPSHKSYFFGHAKGEDISTLRIWKNNLNNPDLKYPCTQLGKLRFECGLGVSQLLEPSNCYESVDLVEFLEPIQQELLLVKATRCPDSDTYRALANVSSKKVQTVKYLVRWNSGEEWLTVRFRR